MAYPFSINLSKQHRANSQNNKELNLKTSSKNQNATESHHAQGPLTRFSKDSFS